MKTYLDMEPENCNHYSYSENVSRHFDIEDYCSRNMKPTNKIDMDKDCPLRKSRIRKYIMKIFQSLQNRRKMEHETEDIIQMNTDILLTDKDGKFIEVKTPKPEYIDSIW